MCKQIYLIYLRKNKYIVYLNNTIVSFLNDIVVKIVVNCSKFQSKTICKQERKKEEKRRGL